MPPTLDDPNQAAERVRGFERQLTAAARLRWGEQRAAALAEPIALMAQALADLADVSFAHDAAEPDFVEACRGFSAVGRAT